MGFFEKPGDYDESSFWYTLRAPEDRALDQAVKANRRLTELRNQLATRAQATAQPQPDLALVETESKLLGLALYARTIVQLLVEKGIIDAQEFTARMRDIDLLDGVGDGK